MTDLDSARRFVQLHGRLLDRRRFAHSIDGGRPEEVVSAVAAYANPDGGYAGVIEPDSRTASSQPIGALTALEVLHEAGAPAGAAVLEWLGSVSHPDGALPFSLPPADGAPHAPWMVPSPGPSLHMTAAVAGAAIRMGADHPWVEAAAAFCRGRISDAAGGLSAYETKYVVRFLDATGDAAALERIGQGIPDDGRLRVAAGTEDETLGLLDLAPHPDDLARRLFRDEQVRVALDELEAGQREDGGWDFDWLRWSPVAAHEWRARLTVDALALLRANGR